MGLRESLRVENQPFLTSSSEYSEMELNIPLTVTLKKFFSNKSKQNIQQVLYAGVVDHSSIAFPLGICLTQHL